MIYLSPTDGPFVWWEFIYRFFQQCLYLCVTLYPLPDTLRPGLTSCDGGYPGAAWDYWVNTGIVTGGAYGTYQVGSWNWAGTSSLSGRRSFALRKICEEEQEEEQREEKKKKSKRKILSLLLSHQVLSPSPLTLWGGSKGVINFPWICYAMQSLVPFGHFQNIFGHLFTWLVCGSFQWRHGLLFTDCIVWDDKGQSDWF